MRRLLVLGALAVASGGCGGSSGGGRIDARDAKKLVVRPAPSGAAVPRAPQTAPLRRVAPNGRWAVVAPARQPVRLVEARTGGRLDTLGTLMQPTAIAWTADSRTFAVGRGDGRISVWEEFDHRTFDLEGVRASVEAVAFSPEGGLLVSTHADGSLRVWDVAHRRQVATIRLPGVADRLVVSADGRRIDAAGATGTWELRLP